MFQPAQALAGVRLPETQQYTGKAGPAQDIPLLSQVVFGLLEKQVEAHF